MYSKSLNHEDLMSMPLALIMKTRQGPWREVMKQGLALETARGKRKTQINRQLNT